MRASFLSLLASLLVGALLVVAAACGDDDGHAGASHDTRTPASATPTLEEPPVRADPSGPPEAVTLTASDGVEIHATLRRGATLDAPAVLLVHQLGATRAEWAPLVDALSEPPGLTTLAIDLRGHGESTRAPDGSELSQHAFDHEAWQKIVLDARAALDFLEQHETLHPRALGAVGSSIGSSAVLAAASEDERVRALVAISPGRAYHGIDAITPASRLAGRAFMLVGAEGESPVMETITDMAAANPSAERAILSGGAHGLAMAEENPDLVPRVATFLRQGLDAR